MNSYIKLLGILVLLFTCGCQKQLDYQQGNYSDQSIVAYSSVSSADSTDNRAESRALVDNNKALSDIVFVRTDNAAGDLSTVNFTGTAAITGSRAAGAKSPIIFTPKQYYDAQDKTAYLAGYYPAGTVAGNAVNWPIDGVNDIILSRPYSAGKVSEQKQAVLDFEHQLSRIEVVVQARAGEVLADVRAAWGKITGLELINTPASLTYNYADNTVSASPIKSVINLSGGAGYDLGTPTATIDIPANGSTAVYAAAMIAPQTQSKLVFRVRGTGGRVSSGIVEAIFSGAIEAGKVHQVVLNLATPVTPPQKYDYVIIKGLRWAKGNLIAESSSDHHTVKIGQWSDYGLYFQFGSLIGWKGGHSQWGGTGVGAPDGTSATNDGYFWNSSKTYSWDNDAMVWPKSLITKPDVWPANGGGTLDKWYFGYNTYPYNARGQKLSEYPGLIDGSLAPKGIGDPCRYYLGGRWRLPSAHDMANLYNNLRPTGSGLNLAESGYWGTNINYPISGKYSNSVPAQRFTAAISPTPYRGNYVNTTHWDGRIGDGTPPTGNILFAPGAGLRNSDGQFYFGGRQSGWWTGMTYDGDAAYYSFILSDETRPFARRGRTESMPVRCVNGPTLSATPMDMNSNAQNITLSIVDTEGSAWTITKTGDPVGAFSPSSFSGKGDGTVTVAVTANTSNDLHAATYQLSVTDDIEVTPTATLRQQFTGGINVNGLIWATGNLVATTQMEQGSVTNNTLGAKVKIGKPTDGGLYFQFGSLIGYKGGNTAGGGRGTGIPHGATTTTPFPDNKFWNLANAYSWANDAMVWPERYTNGAATWPGNSTDNTYYFGHNVAPFDKVGQKLSDYGHWNTGHILRATISVGDPCAYYLGEPWRMPTTEEYGNLFNNQFPNGTVGDVASWTGISKYWSYGAETRSIMAGLTAATSPTEGLGIYANTTATSVEAAKADPNAIFFPASGYRTNAGGSFSLVGNCGYVWSASVYDGARGLFSDIKSTGFILQSSNLRYLAFPVRCVRLP